MTWAKAIRAPKPKAKPATIPRPQIKTADVDWARLVTVDFETYWGTGYTLSSMSTSEYVRDPRFKAQMVGIKIGNKPTKIYPPKQLKRALQAINWSTHSLLCHNTAFDGFIVSHHYGITPAKYYDTLSMARGLHSNEIGASLDDVAGYYGKGSKIADVLESTKDVLDWPKPLYDAAALYCAQDVDLTYEIFKEMHAVLPEEEMELIHMTIRMFCAPVLRVDIPRVEAEYAREIQARKDALLSVIDVRKYDDKTTLKKTAERALEGEERDLLIAKRVFGSNEKFLDLLLNVGVPEHFIPKKVSPAYIKKSREEKEQTAEEDKYTYAFAKDDLDFTNLPDRVWELRPDFDPEDPGHVLKAAVMSNELQSLVDARIATKSTTNITRAERFLKAGADGMPLPVGYSYYRAHTGRFGGNNKMNMQNLTRGGELRLSILAAPGHQMCVADSAQIEARVNAWLWDETDLLAAFARGADIYSEFATDEVYHRVITKADKLERHVGKACIAEDQLVLTHRGLVPINRLSLKDWLWDGVEWVCHDGLIDQGIRDVITYDGLTATPDHEVFTEDGRVIPLGQAASEMARLQTTGAGGAGVRFCDDHVVADTPRKRLSVRQGGMRPDRYYQVDVAEQLGEWENDIVPEEWAQTSSPCGGVGTKVRRDHHSVQQPEEQALDELRRSRHQMPIREQDGLHTVGFDEPATQRLQGRGGRQDRQRQSLHAGESEVGDTQGTDSEPAKHHMGDLERQADAPGRLPQPAEPRLHSTPGESGVDGRGSHQTCLQLGTERAQELALNRRQARVYDIANAGPRRRFTVSGKLVLNCVLGLGYQMGAAKFQMTLAKGALGGPKVNFSLQQTQTIVNAYRRKYAGIAGGWKKCAQIIEEMAVGIEGSYKCLTWGNDDGIGFIDLPNGMRLKYPDLRKSLGDGGWEEWSYQSGPMRKKIYGGLLCLGAETEVLTDSGWKSIIFVREKDKLWDGTDWVVHSGLAYQGTKETIDFGGVDMTSDHEVLVNGEWFAAKETTHHEATSSFERHHWTPDWHADGGSIGHREDDFALPAATQLASVPDVRQTGCKEQAVYDLLNAGPNRRFTVRGKDGKPFVVHNCENLVQALARIIVMWQMLQIDKKYPIVMTTHDECVAHPKTREAQRCYDLMIKWMSTPPWWCLDIPLSAEGGVASNYSK